MATHSSILAWRIPWTGEPDVYSPWGQEHGHDLATKQLLPLIIITICLLDHWNKTSLEENTLTSGLSEECFLLSVGTLSSH